MSTWTSDTTRGGRTQGNRARRRASGAGFAAALLVLSGCGVGEVVSRGLTTSQNAPETLAVAGRSVVVGGPPGYCVDRGASRDAGDSAFVLLGSCAAIARRAGAPAPGTPGLLTAVVAEAAAGAAGPSQPGPETLEAYFRSEAGRAALARDGRAGSVEILETRAEDGAFFVRLRDTSADTMEGMSEAYWRGLFDLNGRLVTVSVVGFDERPLDAGEGFSTIRAFLARIREETTAMDDTRAAL